jgi:hypothetical protein
VSGISTIVEGSTLLFSPKLFRLSTSRLAARLPLGRCVDRPGWGRVKSFERGKMLKITRTVNGDVVFTVSGRMDTENLAGLKTMFSSEANDRRIVLDLKDLILVDQDAVSFLERCEADSIQLRNCPAYIREWIKKERNGR